MRREAPLGCGKERDLVAGPGVEGGLGAEGVLSMRAVCAGGEAGTGGLGWQLGGFLGTLGRPLGVVESPAADFQAKALTATRVPQPG